MYPARVTRQAARRPSSDKETGDGRGDVATATPTPTIFSILSTVTSVSPRDERDGRDNRVTILTAGCHLAR